MQCWNDLMASKGYYHGQHSSTPQRKEKSTSTVPMPQTGSPPGFFSDSAPLGWSDYPMLSALFSELSVLHTRTTGSVRNNKDTRTQSTQTVADDESRPPQVTDTTIGTTITGSGGGKKKFIRTCCQPVKPLKNVNADFRTVIKKVKKQKPCSRKATKSRCSSTTASTVTSKPPIDQKKKIITERNSYNEENQNNSNISEESNSNEHNSSQPDSHGTYDVQVPNNSRASPSRLHLDDPPPSVLPTTLISTASTASLDNTRETFLDRSTLGQKIYLASSLQSLGSAADNGGTNTEDDSDDVSAYNSTSHLNQLPKGVSSLSMSNSSSHIQSPPTTTPLVPSDTSVLSYCHIISGDYEDFSDIEEKIDNVDYSYDYSDDFEAESP